MTVKDLHIGQNSVSFDGWLTLKTALMTALPKRPSRLSILHLDISERFGNVTFVSSFPISLTQNSLAMRNLSLTKSTLNGEPNSKNEGNKDVLFDIFLKMEHVTLTSQKPIKKSCLENFVLELKKQDLEKSIKLKSLDLRQANFHL